MLSSSSTQSRLLVLCGGEGGGLTSLSSSSSSSSPFLPILLSTSVLIPSYCLVSDEIPHKADQCWHRLRYVRERVLLTVIPSQITAKGPCDVTVFHNLVQLSKQLAVLMAYLNYNKRQPHIRVCLWQSCASQELNLGSRAIREPEREPATPNPHHF